MLAHQKSDQLRKRLAQIWGVAPYRVEISPCLDGLQIQLDGKDPTNEQMAQWKKDIAEQNSRVKKHLN